MSTRFLYVVAFGEFAKIGMTTNPELRFQCLNQQAPLPLEVLCFGRESWWGRREADLLGQWQGLRLNGEWLVRDGALERWALDKKQELTASVRGYSHLYELHPLRRSLIQADYVAVIGRAA